LKARGLAGVKLVISDAHTGLIAAIQTVLHAIDFKGKDAKAIGVPDAKICGGPDSLDV